MEFSLGRTKFPLVFHHFGSCFNIPFFSNILCNLNLVLDFMLEFSFTINQDKLEKNIKFTETKKHTLLTFNLADDRILPIKKTLNSPYLTIQKTLIK